MSKKQKTQFEETEKTSEPDMTGMLELDWEFKTTMINILRALNNRVNSMQ